jgi:hypothetical protein
MTYLYNWLAAVLCSAAFALSLCAQSVPFDAARWVINAQQSRVEDYLGRRSLSLKGGHATVKDSVFTDGVIEFDIALTGERGFTGAVWRLQDDGNYEEFYLRPHQSGNPDANQYTPSFNGITGWQLYHGEGYGAPVRYRFNEWMHVKIVVSGQQAEFYIEDMEKPALFAHELKRVRQAGRVGLSAGNFAVAHFSNFSFTPLEKPVLKSAPRPAATAPAGTVMSWQVSNVFTEKSLEQKYQLTAADKAALTWQTLACERTGLANLARLQGISGEKNTVFARLTIVSEREQVKQFRFGFSDRVKVYFNDRLIYGGSDNYLSRDYRFLGTIGYFDELYLPLQRGANELWLAVSEDFGGWGIQARFEETAGISFR